MRGVQYDLPSETQARRADTGTGQGLAIAVNGGATDDDADAEAWNGLIEQFSELRQYDGIASETLYRNHYRCPDDGTQWIDEWSCMCNDRCPTCNREIEPYESEEVNTH